MSKQVNQVNPSFYKHSCSKQQQSCIEKESFDRMLMLVVLLFAVTLVIILDRWGFQQNHSRGKDTGGEFINKAW